MLNENQSAPNTSDVTNDRVTASPPVESACHIIQTEAPADKTNTKTFLTSHLILFGLVKALTWVSVGFVFGRIAMSCGTPIDSVATTWAVAAIIAIQSLVLIVIWRTVKELFQDR